MKEIMEKEKPLNQSKTEGFFLCNKIEPIQPSLALFIRKPSKDYKKLNMQKLA